MTLLLSSCSGPIYIYLYNNTNSNIQASNESKKIEIVSGENEYIKVVNQIALCIENKKYQYIAYENLPPGENYGQEHFPLHSIHYQVEERGLLYLVKPDDRLPSELSRQPKGFPVKSKKTTNCNLTSTSIQKNA